MDEARVIEAAKEYVARLFKDDAGGHGADHTLRVYANAMLICRDEVDCDRTLVALAALLHDADDYKLFKTEDNANARRFLSSQGVAPEYADRICKVINGVSFSKNRGKKPDTLEGMIVQDADRLDAIGAVGIARTFAYGGEHGRSLVDSIKHFYDKLLLLKGEMNTDTAKRVAEERHAFMEEFLTRLQREQQGKE